MRLALYNSFGYNVKYPDVHTLVFVFLAKSNLFCTKPLLTTFAIIDTI